MDDAAAEHTLPPIAWRGLSLVVIAVAVVLLVVNGRYGYHRDELYFLACGRHAAWGYPDQPPLTPILARAFDVLGGGSLTVFRIPALASVLGSGWVSALVARELGGRSRAQLLACVATLLGTFALLSAHILLTSTVDLLVWVVLSWLVLRIARTGGLRLWPAVGAVLAVGLLNKQLVLVLVVGLVLGLLAVPGGWRLLANRWCVLASGIAALAWFPVLLWQAQHGWPQLTISREIRTEYGTPGERAGFLALQLVLFSLGATVLWVLGLVRMWRDPRWRFARVLPVSWLVVVATFALIAGQSYYTAGLYPALIAGGAVTVERRARAFWAVGAGVLATSALMVPAALPVVSAGALARSPWAGLAETQFETVGWPRLASEVDHAVDSLPEDQRAEAVVVTSNYGEAGALDRYARTDGGAEAYSGHNGYGEWGPPPAGARPVVVVWEDGSPSAYFRQCRLFVRVGGAIANEESDRAAIYICAGPREDWSREWPRLVHLSS